MHLTVNLIDLGIFFAGFFLGIIFVLIPFLRVQKRLKEYQRRLEKTSVQSDSDSSKVAVLEAKIATLEKALQSALDKNN